MNLNYYLGITICILYSLSSPPKVPLSSRKHKINICLLNKQALKTLLESSPHIIAPIRWAVTLSHRRLRKRRKQPRINKLPLTSHDTLAPLLTSVVLLCPCLQNEILRQLFPLVKKNHIFWHYKKNLNRKIFSVLWPFSPRCTWCIHISKSEVTQPCANLCNPMDCSLPGSYVHGIFQASVLEWVAISFSRVSSQPRGSLPSELPGKPQTLPASRKYVSLMSSWEARMLCFLLDLRNTFCFPQKPLYCF